MFRNQYDTDCITWSPAGRIHQIEYAMEAVKQGSACIGLRSNDFAIVATLKRSSSELSSYQKKIFKIDDNIGIGIAGLVADARVLAKYMRTECINHRYVYDEPMQVGRLVIQVADKAQVGTQRVGRRPYGVGLLIIGADQTGPHLFEAQPTGQYFEYKVRRPHTPPSQGTTRCYMRCPFPRARTPPLPPPPSPRPRPPPRPPPRLPCSPPRHGASPV